MKPDDTTRRAAPDPEATAVGQSRTDWARVDALTDEQAAAAAAADPDNPEWSDDQLARSRRAPLVKQLRFRLGLGRAEFAARYRIDEALIAAWERREAEPDSMARAYLNVIAADPEGVARTLAADAAE